MSEDRYPVKIPAISVPPPPPKLRKVRSAPPTNPKVVALVVKLRFIGTVALPGPLGQLPATGRPKPAHQKVAPSPVTLSYSPKPSAQTPQCGSYRTGAIGAL